MNLRGETTVKRWQSLNSNGTVLEATLDLFTEAPQEQPHSVVLGMEAERVEPLPMVFSLGVFYYFWDSPGRRAKGSYNRPPADRSRSGSDRTVFYLHDLDRSHAIDEYSDISLPYEHSISP